MCNHHWCPFRALHEIQAQLARIERKVGQIQMSQSDIDQAVAADTALLNDLAAQVANVQSAQAGFASQIQALNDEIAALQGQGVDTSNLVAITSQLTAEQATVDAAVSALGAAANPPAPPAA